MTLHLNRAAQMMELWEGRHLTSWKALLLWEFGGTAAWREEGLKLRCDDLRNRFFLIW